MQTKLEIYIDTNVFYELEKSAREADKSVVDYVLDFLPTLIKNNNDWLHSLIERQKAMEEEIHPKIKELSQILTNPREQQLDPDKEAITKYLWEKYG